MSQCTSDKLDLPLMILQNMHAAEDIVVLVNCDVGWLVRGLVREFWMSAQG